MREIKFRAWDKEANHMYYNSGHVIIDMKGHCFNLQTGVQLEPLLFTGLKDKNGKEIYKGDIIKARYMTNVFQNRSPKSYDVTIKVIFRDCGFRGENISKISSHHLSRNWKYSSLTKAEIGSLEVIGSIYENPDLFK